VIRKRWIVLCSYLDLETGEVSIRNCRLTEEEFLRERKEVLSLWPTGKEIEDIDEAIEFQKNLPREQNAATVLAQAKKEGRTLVQPRGGVNLLHEHIEVLKILEEEGGADLLPSTIDSYTRNARYAEAQKAIEANMKQGRASVLNGLPAVNLGVKQCRKIREAVSVPLAGRTCAPFPRLLAETLMASGFTSMEGGGITCLIPYTKTDSLEKSIRRWQYVTRMMSYYHDRGGVPIHRESYGPMTGVLLPPCITNAVSILECIMDCEQGVHNYSLGYGMGGNISQDVVAIRAIEDVCREYLERLGYEHVNLTTYFHEYMGAFPQDEAKASC
jgi:methylaspartate mutase epsilon subunit